jgi:hypothetical protein
MAGRSYDAAQQALGLLDRGAPVEDVARALRPGVGPDVDVEQYYRWALDGDRYQVCEPPDTVFAPIAKAQARLAGRLSRQVADALAALANPGPGDLETEMAKVRKRLESALGQEPDLLRLLWRLCGNADRVAFARRAAVAPAIDGRLDDACWQQAATYTAFWVNSSASPARWRTEFSLAFDDANLYCAFRCYQDTQKILVGSSGRDGRVWREDSIELLLNRPDEQDPARYFQFMSNSEGNIFDMLDKNADVNVNAKVGTSVQKDHYVLEWALPFREIGLDPAKDRRLRLNVVRNLYEKKSGRGSQAQTELSNWYLTAGANADLDARGWLFLVER